MCFNIEVLKGKEFMSVSENKSGEDKVNTPK